MYEFLVSGMNCGSCVNRIKKAIALIDPQGKVDVDLHTQTIKVIGKRSLDEISQAIEESGYSILQKSSRN